jgi:hypothetical protein
MTNEDEKRTAGLRDSYGQIKDAAPAKEKPIKEQLAADEGAKRQLELINRLPQVFVHGATVLKGSGSTDLCILNDIMGNHQSVLILPKEVSKVIADSLA